MADKHVAGPWRFELGNVYAANGDMVAQDVDRVDGRLIASAPALLALAEQALGQLDVCVNTGQSVPGDLRDDLRRGIEDATGRALAW